MLTHVQTIGDCSHAPRWKLDADEFRGCVGHKVHSAPGPDGIPHGCWEVPEATDALFKVYEE
eukprot:6216371-Pyramimonas_sp.AAC.1